MNYIKKFFNVLRNLILLSLLIILVIFMVSNRQTIDIDFSPLPFIASMRIFTLMLTCFLLGVFLTILIFSQKFVKNFFNNYRNQNKIKKLQKQISLQQEKI